jgi:hypothetical protein
MSSPNETNEVSTAGKAFSSRRQFLVQSVAAAGLSALAGKRPALGADEAEAGPPRPFVGIQIAAHSFFDEGIDHCLDLLKETAGVNALLISSHKPCWNNPDYRGYLLGTMRDMFETYPLDGLQYGAERPTPMTDVIFKGKGFICFCEHCQARGKKEGIDVARAREGGKMLYELVTALREGKAHTPDGVLPEFLAVLLKYPELLAWERMWHESGNEVHKLWYDQLKAIRPQADIGRHVDHRQSSWDLFYRAGSRYQDMPEHADFIKPILYHDILGPRLQANYLEPLQQGLLKELPLPQSLNLFYAWFGLSQETEPNLSKLAEGLSPEYVYRETKRAVAGAAGRAAVYSGIGLDIPKGGGWGTDVWQSDPDEVYLVVRKAFDAGAAGIVASREYEEITTSSLRVVGRAVRDHQNKSTTLTPNKEDCP